MKLSPGFIFITVSVLAFSGWMGVRIKDALHTKAALASERVEVAKSAVASASAPLKVKTVHAESTTWNPRVSFEGTLNPAHEADLGFKLPGRLSRINVRVGDRVSQGQTLASLEQSDAEAQVRAAEAQMRAAEAQLAMASDGERRTQQLLASGSTSPQMGIQSQQQRALVEAQRDGARAQVELARASLKNHSLAAPFAGVITKVPSGVGAIVGPGSPLVRIEETATLKLTGTVGEGEVPMMKAGDPVEVRAGSVVLNGKLNAVLPSVDAATRRVPVEVELKNDAKAPLLARSFVRASVLSNRAVQVLRLPHEALRPGTQNEVLTVANGVLESRILTLAIADNGDLLVRAGISASDEIVLNPSAEAKTGDKVDATASPSAVEKK